MTPADDPGSDGWAVRALVWLIRLYQRGSGRLPPMCRFRPSCSEYAIRALRAHGLLRGLALSCARILRCNPLCPGGDDPVPPKRRPEANVTRRDKNGQIG